MYEFTRGADTHNDFLGALFLWLIAGLVPMALLGLRGRRLLRLAGWVGVRE